MQLTPITYREASAFIDRHHRHHIAPQGWLFGVGLVVDGVIVGVGVTGRPVSRHVQSSGYVGEITRMCVIPGHKNGCSKLYSALWRAARALGYKMLITYTLASESGASLRASGWRLDADGVGGGSWSRDGRERTDKHPTEQKNRWVIGQWPDNLRPRVSRAQPAAKTLNLFGESDAQMDS